MWGHGDSALEGRTPPGGDVHTTIEFDSSYLRQLEAQRASIGAMAERERQLAMLQPAAGERMLDLGCGGGAYSRAIAELVGPSGAVVGVDASPHAGAYSYGGTS